MSVVIVNWNGAHHLKACLPSLRACGQSMEIVVIDNGSNDGSVDYLKQQPDVELVEMDSNVGFAEGNNVGVARATGDFVMLLNNDTIVDKDFLPPLLEAMEDPAVGACQSKTLTTANPPTIDAYGSCMTWTGFMLHRKYGQQDVPVTPPFEVFAAKAAALLVRRSAIEATGVFDPDFFAYLEDSDLSWRLWLAGWKILCVPESVVYHVAGATARTLPSEFVVFHSYKNRISTLMTNLSGAGLARMLPVHIALTLALSAVYVMSGKFAQAKGIMRSIGWNVTHVRATLRKRKHVQKTIRKKSDRQLRDVMMCRVRLSWFYYALKGFEDYRE